MSASGDQDAASAKGSARPSGAVSAHTQMETLHVMQRVEEHDRRENDPHYHLFEAVKRRLKRQGLWKCVIADELCSDDAELHHSEVEFSEINSTDPQKVAKALGLHFENDEEFQAFIEGPGNLEVLCSNHHRTRYGVHVLPEPLWKAVRYKRADAEAPAEHLTAEEAEHGAG